MEKRSRAVRLKFLPPPLTPAPDDSPSSFTFPLSPPSPSSPFQTCFFSAELRHKRFNNRRRKRVYTGLKGRQSVSQFRACN